MTWYATSRRYPLERVAKLGWEIVNQRLKNRGLELGIYRHGPSDEQGQYLTAVSLKPEGIERVEGLLPPGERFTPDDETLEALILRRCRVILEQEGQGEGYMQIRRGLAAGARLNPDGTMDEWVGRG